MSKMKAGFIGFMPQGKEGFDIYAALKSYADLGYSGFEGGDMLLRDGDPAENLKRVESFGIRPISIGYMKGFGAETTAEDLIRDCKILGINRVRTYAGCVGMFRFGMAPEPPSYDTVMREIEEYETIATALDKEGISFAFHNHDIELKQTYRGVPALYLMCANSEKLKIELDVGWVHYAGKNPAVVIRDLGDRICDLHIKDYIDGSVEQKTPTGGTQIMPRFTTPGTGLLNLSEVLEEGSKLGLEWAVVEQDFQYNLTEKETLAAAYLNMRETGFVE